MDGIWPYLVPYCSDAVNDIPVLYGLWHYGFLMVQFIVLCMSIHSTITLYRNAAEQHRTTKRNRTNERQPPIIRYEVVDNKDNNNMTSGVASSISPKRGSRIRPLAKLPFMLFNIDTG
jgi:hypothetical protein